MRAVCRDFAGVDRVGELVAIQLHDDRQVRTSSEPLLEQRMQVIDAVAVNVTRLAAVSTPRTSQPFTDDSVRRPTSSHVTNVGREVIAVLDFDAGVFASNAGLFTVAVKRTDSGDARKAPL